MLYASVRTAGSSPITAVGDALTVLADSGVLSGFGVLADAALGAKGVLLGRPYGLLPGSSRRIGRAPLAEPHQAGIVGGDDAHWQPFDRRHRVWFAG